MNTNNVAIPTINNTVDIFFPFPLERYFVIGSNLAIDQPLDNAVPTAKPNKTPPKAPNNIVLIILTLNKKIGILNVI